MHPLFGKRHDFILHIHLYVYVPHFPYIFVSWWTSGWILCLSYYKLSCYKDECTDNFHMVISFPLGKFLKVSRLHYRKSTFSFLGNPDTAFLNHCSSLHFLQQCFRVLFPPHPCQHLLLLLPLKIDILTRGMCNFIAVCICISVTASYHEHIFTYLLVIYITSFEKMLVHSLAHFLNGFLLRIFLEGCSYSGY